MSKKEVFLFWAVLFIGLGFFIASISEILLPFVVGLIVAYFLDPAADKLEEWGTSRTLATLFIIVLFFFIVTMIGLVLVPLFYDQLVNFIKKVPSYVELFNTQIMPKFEEISQKINPDALENAKDAVKNISGSVFSFVGKMIGGVWNSGLAVINLLSLIFITPIVTFYMLRDWDNIMAKIKTLMPPKYAPTILEQIGEIDRTLSGYIRGQTNVCLLLGLFYAIGLSLVGLDFAIFIGLGTGLLSFIPYVGLMVGFAVGIIVAFFQYGDAFHMSLVIAVFVAGQFLEGNFVTPKLVGDKVGLHPVWIIFGMLSGAAMFGFIGILVAIPATAMIGVLVRFAIKHYLQSSFYLEQKKKVAKKKTTAKKAATTAKKA